MVEEITRLSREEGRQRAYELMVYMEGLLRGGRFVELNDHIVGFGVEECCSTHELIALVRSCYRVRDMLPGWEGVVYRCVGRVREMGEDPSKVYIGFDKKFWS